MCRPLVALILVHLLYGTKQQRGNVQSNTGYLRGRYIPFRTASNTQKGCFCIDRWLPLVEVYLLYGIIKLLYGIIKQQRGNVQSIIQDLSGGEGEIFRAFPRVFVTIQRYVESSNM